MTQNEQQTITKTQDIRNLYAQVPLPKQIKNQSNTQLSKFRGAGDL